MKLFVVFAAFATLADGARRLTVDAHKANGSLKKGIIMAPTSRLQCEDLGLFNPENYGWWYSWRQAPVFSWNKSEACTELLSKSHFVPMIKNEQFTEDDQLKDTYLRSPYLFGFNEPYGDHSHKGTGSHAFSPDDAVEAMKIVIEKAESVHPPMEIIAPTVNPKKKATDWYDQFHAKAVEAGIWSKFTYINVHSYSCNAKQLMKKLKKVYKAYGLPMWLSEFNCNGASNYNTTAAEHLHFMKDILPMLEASPFIARYSWYTLRNGAMPNANLAQGVGQKEGEGWINELTELGHYYNDFVPSAVVEAATEEIEHEHEEEVEDERDAEPDDDDSTEEWFRTPDWVPEMPWNSSDLHSH